MRGEGFSYGAGGFICVVTEIALTGDASHSTMDFGNDY
ncbi:hypothetical protein HMPREF0889_0729 [Megasphaera lornae]|uniref:Uncharacterized protein n=1 Tax=Megasphaera lornae TaxID=1000568 RepID=D3LWS1_9FIRM|nr:hypothetical protein HMPREF0889_0729 [Megasphaera genomosp. type_1 str. 28L]